MLQLESFPHIGEQIFVHFDTPVLLKWRLVSKVWKKIAEDALAKLWKDKIFLALETNRFGIIKILLEHPKCEEIDWNVTQTEQIGFADITPFMWACKNGQTNVVKLFMDHSDKNIDLNAKCIGSHGGWTALMWACINGHTEIVKLLLNHSNPKIDVNPRDECGFTAFMAACLIGNYEIIKMLLDQTDPSIDVNAKANDESTGFMSACTNIKLENINEHKEVVKLLLDHPEIDFNAQEYWGETAFMQVCSFGNLEIVKLLLE